MIRDALIAAGTVLGWAWTALVGLTALTLLFASPIASFGLLLWALLFTPPLWRYTQRINRQTHIWGRLGVFVFAMILIGAAPKPPTTATAPTPTPAMAPSSIEAVAPTTTPTAVAASPSPIKVVSTGDGDTLRVLQNGKTVTVRLACIDAPESAQQPWGSAAAGRLAALLPKNSAVTMRIVDKDRYGRTVAETFKDGTLINLQMVEEGHAVAYRDYLAQCNAQQYLAAEERAKASKLAFWNQNDPVMPWDFRRNPTPQPKQTAQPQPPKASIEAPPAPAPAAVDPNTPVRDPVSGSCDCPYDTDSRGRSCGRRSAYSKPGGSSPICYESDR